MVFKDKSHAKIWAGNGDILRPVPYTEYLAQELHMFMTAGMGDRAALLEAGIIDLSDHINQRRVNELGLHRPSGLISSVLESLKSFD